MTSFILAVLAVTITALEGFNFAGTFYLVCYMSLKVIFFSLAFYGMFLVVNTYRKGGLSKQYRMLLRRRHVSYCIVIIFIQFTELIGAIKGVNMIKGTGMQVPTWLERACVYFYSSSGIILVIVRMFDPLVFDTFKKDINYLCCNCFKRKPQQDAADVTDDNIKIEKNTDLLTDNLNSFLTSSLNVELVYTILEGVRRIVSRSLTLSYSLDMDAEMAAMNLSSSDEGFEKSVLLTFDKIEIPNFKFWENSLQQ